MIFASAMKRQMRIRADHTKLAIAAIFMRMQSYLMAFFQSITGASPLSYK